MEIDFDEVKISPMSKYKFKKFFKKKMQTAAFNFLMMKKETHSKMAEVTYKKLEIQPYLNSDSGLTDQQKQLVTNLKTQMFKVRQNLKNQNQLCQLCE